MLSTIKETKQISDEIIVGQTGDNANDTKHVVTIDRLLLSHELVYVCNGEFAAFVIAWNLIMEYVVIVALISKALIIFFDALFFGSVGHLTEMIPMSWYLGEHFDVLALLIPIIIGGKLKIAPTFSVKVPKNIFVTHFLSLYVRIFQFRCCCCWDATQYLMWFQSCWVCWLSSFSYFSVFSTVNMRTNGWLKLNPSPIWENILYLKSIEAFYSHLRNVWFFASIGVYSHIFQICLGSLIISDDWFKHSISLPLSLFLFIVIDFYVNKIKRFLLFLFIWKSRHFELGSQTRSGKRWFAFGWTNTNRWLFCFWHWRRVQRCCHHFIHVCCIRYNVVEPMGRIGLLPKRQWYATNNHRTFHKNRKPSNSIN